jgi:hypothetical protein
MERVNSCATMCYMASTSEHISIRIPTELMEALRRESLELERSVSWVIVRKLSGRRAEGRAQSAGSYPHLASRTSSTVAKADAEQVSSPAAPEKTPGHHPRCGCSICKGSAK